MAPERQREPENPLCFSAVFFPRTRYDDVTETQPVKIYTFEETHLKDGLDLKLGAGGGFHLADVNIDLGVKARNPNQPPEGAALVYSSVSGYYVFLGGYLLDGGDPYERDTPTRNVWSFKPAAPGPHTWGVRATLERHRAWALAVPYDDGRIFIFAGDHLLQPSLEIYDPRSGSVSRPTVFDDEDIFPPFPERAGFVGCRMRFLPLSYFLWKERRLIMLHFQDIETHEHKLLSYNVEEEHLELFDSEFPYIVDEPRRTLLVPLDGINTLLIMERPDYWRVYDLSSKKLSSGGVRVAGFELYRGRTVMHAFSRLCRDGSHIVHIFMDGLLYKYNPTQFSIPYAVLSLRKVGGEFVASVQSKGALGNDKCRDYFIFANQKEAPDLGGGFSDPERKRQRV